MHGAIAQSLQPPRASAPVLVPCQQTRHFCLSSRTRTLLHDARGAHASAAPEPAGQRAYLRCTAHSHTHIALNSARLDVFGRAHGCGRHSEENEWLKWRLRAGTVEPAHFARDPYPARQTASPAQPALRSSASTSCPLLFV